MSNKYFVKGAVTNYVEVPEPRSHNKIRKMPYAAYNNRTYNSYRDLKTLNEKLKRMTAVISKVIKNQGATMFKYLSIYVQNRQEQETRAQLKVIHEGLLRFSHAINLHDQRQKCVAFYQFTRIDYQHILKEQLKLPLQNLKEDRHHISNLESRVFHAWLKITLQSKLRLHTHQQHENMVNFYKFLLNTFANKSKAQLSWSFKRLKHDRRKQTLGNIVSILELARIRVLIHADSAQHQFVTGLNKQLIMGFHKIREFQRFDIHHSYAVIVITNILNGRIRSHKSSAMHKIRQVSQQNQQNTVQIITYITAQYRKYCKQSAFNEMIKYVFYRKQMQSVDIELTRQLTHYKLEHKKSEQRMIRSKPITNDQLFETLSKVFWKYKFIAFQFLKVSSPPDIYLPMITNLSIINGELNHKIKIKSAKVSVLQGRQKLFQIFHRQESPLKISFQKWQINATFEPNLYKDLLSRIEIMKNENDVIQNDIEQFLALNNETEVQAFEPQDQLSQGDINICNEYVDFLMNLHDELTVDIQENQHKMEEEERQLEQELKQLESQL